MRLKDCTIWCLGLLRFSSYLDPNRGNRYDVDTVEEHLQQTWIAFVAEEPFENAAKEPVFMEQGEAYPLGLG